ncbi:TBC domain-containing protein kinase-like protein isoform X3 [Rhodnius prolixus]|uniref:TBC domain-containing protein kinase-like protein isoform X3 n=1 Tax=Rhodnius prolixus TaxID=13249 RepID=UPI003D18AC5E
MDKDKFEYYFCGMTFVAKQRSHEHCGSNGLPLTPNSIRILGRSQFLKTLYHPNICLYVDILRGKHERTVIVTEKVGTSLSNYRFKSWLEVLSMARHVLQGLDYIHRNGVVHRFLAKENICKDHNSWRLFNFGLYYMTDNGADVPFPIGCLKYTCPLVLYMGPHHVSSCKADIWSLGIILTELLLDCNLWKDLSQEDTIRKIFELIKKPGSFFREMAKDASREDIFSKLPQDIVNFVDKALQVDPRNRPLAKDLLKDDIFYLIRQEVAQSKIDNRQMCEQRLDQQSILELYHYWQLAGGDVISELKKDGLMRSRLPILNLPNVVLLEGRTLGVAADSNIMPSLTVVHLDATHILHRLRKLKHNSTRLQLTTAQPCETQTLPLVIKERDTEYQFVRIQLFNEILHAMPLSRDHLVKVARQDIAPFVRAQVWSELLHISPDYQTQYRLIDKESPLPTDRQIEVDIPRCHQYNELLSSSVGHLKFKRILKAWVKNHPHYVYWQGLDSLAAPFLFLNFDDEARGYASLTNFISKYLHNFFLQDNSAVIKEYLAKLRQLLAFHDPILASHLHYIGFSPELFAIPWFLTMFSHVFPIHKILHLWDSLILGDASYPLYIGVSMLQQLRNVLLNSGFNECILLFSDLPEINIEKCVMDSILYYQSTPSSVTYRQHQLQGPRKNSLDLLPISIAELQSEFSPRISASELHDLIVKPLLRSKILVVDIREQIAFSKLRIEGSVNIPCSSEELNVKGNKKSEIGFIQRPEMAVLYSNKGKIIVIIGEEMKLTSEAMRFYCDWSMGQDQVLYSQCPRIFILLFQQNDHKRSLGQELQS